jgi:type I restriction enzyme S subunit
MTIAGEESYFARIIPDELPSEWRRSQLSNICTFQSGKTLATSDRKNGEIPVYGSNGEVGTHNESITGSPTIVIGRKGSAGAVNFSDEAVFVIDTAYYVDSRWTTANLRWLYYLLISLQLEDQAEHSAIPGINRKMIGSHIVPIPPIQTQNRIANYLDSQVSQIEDLIQNHRTLRDTLEEKRQAVISHYVTKGVSENTIKKGAKLSWLESIPSHWEIIDLKYLAEVQTGIAKGKTRESDELEAVPYLRVENVQEGFLDLSEVKELELTQKEIEQYSLQEGDVLMNEGGDYDKLGRGTVWKEELKPCVHQNHVFAIRPNDREDAEWISKLTESSYLKHYFMISAKQTTNLASISASNIKSAPLIWPPKDEREQILEQIQRTTSKIEDTKGNISKEINLLKDRKQSLIRNIITGQIEINESDNHENEVAL